MRLDDIFDNFYIEPTALIILTRESTFQQFMAGIDNAHDKAVFEEDLNFAELIAEDARTGGKYYPFIKDLRVEEVIPFTDDWGEENYALIIDVTEDQVKTIQHMMKLQEYICTP